LPIIFLKTILSFTNKKIKVFPKINFYTTGAIVVIFSLNNTSKKAWLPMLSFLPSIFCF